MRFYVFQFILLSMLTASFLLAEEASVPGACKLNDNFFQTAEGGCKEIRSGLVWSGKVNLLGGNTASCNIIQGGYDDWRFPTLKELSGVAGPTRAGDHFNFEIGNATYFVSSTKAMWHGRLTSIAISLATGKLMAFAISYPGFEDYFRVLCVRGNPLS